MMLSPQAARMGTVYTTLRKLGMSRFLQRAPNRHFAPSASVMYYRFNSTLAEYEEDEIVHGSKGFEQAALLRGSSHREPNNAAAAAAWTINLGRECDEWLVGPRPDHWFTGLHPHECPGFANGSLRSQPLPRLSQVTRQAAKDYFDNSWTLYETLFAGIRGEEGFYRPPVHGLRHPQIFYYGHTGKRRNMLFVYINLYCIAACSLSLSHTQLVSTLTSYV
jgi:hypothetical protein